MANLFTPLWTGIQVMSHAGELLSGNWRTNEEAAREAALADREHTEMREDTAVQRLKADYEAAGINPWLIGSSGGMAPSSPSTANMDAFKGLITGLEYNMKLTESQNKNNNRNLSSLTKLIQTIFNGLDAFS